MTVSKERFYNLVNGIEGKIHELEKQIAELTSKIEKALASNPPDFPTDKKKKKKKKLQTKSK